MEKTCETRRALYAVQESLERLIAVVLSLWGSFMHSQTGAKRQTRASDEGALDWSLKREIVPASTAHIFRCNLTCFAVFGVKLSLEFSCRLLLLSVSIFYSSSHPSRCFRLRAALQRLVLQALTFFRLLFGIQNLPLVQQIVRTA